MSQFKVGDKVIHKSYPGVVWELLARVYHSTYPGWHCIAVQSYNGDCPVGTDVDNLWSHLLTLHEPEVPTTGITACREAKKKGFRIQVRREFWVDVHWMPKFDCPDHEYRVHPDDVPKYTAWVKGEPLTTVQKPKAHFHAELIKAWADGARIQACTSTGKWVYVQYPNWRCDTQYRIEINEQPTIPKRVFDKADLRREVKYGARYAKLKQQQVELNQAIIALQQQYESKRERAAAFAKEHVE